MDGSLSSPKPSSIINRQETISKNLKDEFNGEDDNQPSNDSVVIKEELGGRISTPRGGMVGGRVGGGREDGYDDEDPDGSLCGEGGAGGGAWGELALAGPSGLQQNSDANQPVSFFFVLLLHVLYDVCLYARTEYESNIFSSCPQDY